jgi:hypothetical protein
MLRIIVEPFVNLYAVELPQLRGQRRVDGVDLHAIEQMPLRDDVASMAWTTSRRWRGTCEVASMASET